MVNSKEEVKKAQIIVSDLNLELTSLKRSHEMVNTELAQIKASRHDLQLEFNVYKQTHEYVVLDTDKVKSELASRKEIFKKEIAIYKEKVAGLK